MSPKLLNAYHIKQIHHVQWPSRLHRFCFLRIIYVIKICRIFLLPFAFMLLPYSPSPITQLATMLCCPLLSYKSCLFFFFFPQHSKIKSCLHTSYIFLPIVSWCHLRQEIPFLAYRGFHSSTPPKIGLVHAGLYLSQCLKWTGCPVGTDHVVEAACIGLQAIFITFHDDLIWCSISSPPVTHSASIAIPLYSFSAV